MKCLVTGSSGFVGRELCRALLARGDSIVALSKSGATLPDGTATTALDLACGLLPDEQLRGVEVVFHLAGIAHQRAADDAYEQLNYQATLRLARQAAAAGARRFIFLSSVKAMGPAGGAGVRREGDITAPTDPYGSSKWRAERSLQEEFASGPMSVVILRPALVYGPGAKGNLQLLARAVNAGLPRPPSAGGRSMIAVQDLAELLCSCADLPVKGVRTWIAADGQVYTTRAICDALRHISGRQPGVAWLPLWVWRLAAGVLDRVSPAAGESRYEKMFGQELYSNEAVCAATGWRPRYTLLESLPQIVAGQGRSN